MSEDKKTPFEQAHENAKIFCENVDMMHSLSQLKNVIEESKELSSKEKDTIEVVIETAIHTLSKYLTDRGDRWN